MLQQVCDFVHNYFVLRTYVGEFTIAGGTISLPSILYGQRFRIIGSALNDGIYTYSEGGVIKDDDGAEEVQLAAETFNGTIQLMGVPVMLDKLVEEISDWNTKNQAVMDSPYQSESFGGYSYTKATGGKSGGSGVFTWQDAFRSRLNAYRKIA